MFPIISFRVDSTNEERAKWLTSIGIGEIRNANFGICKSCKQQQPLTEQDMINTYFQHSCTDDWPKTSLNKKNLVTKRFFEFDYVKLLSKIKDVLTVFENVIFSEDFGCWLASSQGKQVPIFILGIPQPVSYLSDVFRNKSQSVIIYLEDSQIQSIKTIFSENNFVKIDDLITDPQTIITKTNAIARTFTPNEAIECSRIIRYMQEKVELKTFEDIFCNWFNSLGSKKTELESFLEHLKMDQNNPAGAKYVPTGGNYPSDFENIVLSDYFNQALLVHQTKSYEIKAYAETTNFTRKKFDDKILSNKGNKLLFLVSSNKVDPGVWKEIFEYRKNQGSWQHIVLDFDLIVCLVLGSASLDYFKQEADKRR